MCIYIYIIRITVCIIYIYITIDIHVYNIYIYKPASAGPLLVDHHPLGPLASGQRERRSPSRAAESCPSGEAWSGRLTFFDAKKNQRNTSFFSDGCQMMSPHL